ncbi:MAG: histidinol-phosphate transaminase [Proteobacteria bacterium]|nr:histidinol-phosphate transaminase [Pseudomonadota bacterium]
MAQTVPSARAAAPAAPEPRPGIMDIAAYVGGESKIAGAHRVIKLASNESALGPSAKAIAAYRALADGLHRYPEGGSEALRDALGARYGLDPARIVCGAGSDELIALLVRGYVGPGDQVVYSRHGFLMYPIAAQAAGATAIAAPERNLTADVDALLAAITPRTRIVFLANPNNPTGTYITAEELKRLQAGLPRSVLLVIDAAYAEFVVRNDYSAGEDLVAAHDNVVMMRTFSKIYALAALRLGWAYCPPAVADVLNRIRGPFNVNAAAQAAGVAALLDQPAFDAARTHNDVWRPWLTEALTRLGLTVTPSVANFLLVHFKNAEAANEHLLGHGIITRKMAAYGLPNCLRISVGTETECRAVADTLAAFVKQG